MGTYVALRPMGLTLTIPFRNSTKVPLRTLSIWWVTEETNHLPLYRKVHVGEVVENEIDEFLVFVFTEILYEGLRFQPLSHLECSKAALRESVIKVLGNYRAMS